MEAKKSKKRQQPSDTSFDYKNIEQLKENAGITEEYLQACEEHHRKRGTPFSRDILFSTSCRKKSTS